MAACDPFGVRLQCFRRGAEQFADHAGLIAAPVLVVDFIDDAPADAQIAGRGAGALEAIRRPLNLPPRLFYGLVQF